MSVAMLSPPETGSQAATWQPPRDSG